MGRCRQTGVASCTSTSKGLFSVVGESLYSYRQPSNAGIIIRAFKGCQAFLSVKRLDTAKRPGLLEAPEAQNQGESRRCTLHSADRAAIGIIIFAPVCPECAEPRTTSAKSRGQTDCPRLLFFKGPWRKSLPSALFLRSAQTRQRI
jgi:hypothetical protein